MVGNPADVLRKAELIRTYEAINKLMVVAVGNRKGSEQADFELDAIALYVGAQLCTVRADTREIMIKQLLLTIREVIDSRLAAQSKALDELARLGQEIETDDRTVIPTSK